MFPQKQTKQTPPHLGMGRPAESRGTYKIRHNYANYLIAGDIRINVPKTLIGFIGFIEKTDNSCGIKKLSAGDFIDDAKARKLSEDRHHGRSMFKTVGCQAAEVYGPGLGYKIPVPWRRPARRTSTPRNIRPATYCC